MEGEPDIFQICVDGAAAAGLEFLLIGGHAVNARGYLRTTLDYDFLLASRDLREGHRALLGKDYLDILTLIRRNGIDTRSSDFLEILNRHGTDSIRERLARDL